MLIRTRRSWEISENEVTPPAVYRERRAFMARFGVAAAGAMLPGVWAAPALAAWELGAVSAGPFGTEEAPTAFSAATTYNNFYEFGTGKRDPSRRAGDLRTHPWTVAVSGLCSRPGVYAIEDLVAGAELEERVYRLRCVEAWSMVIPWIGIPLARLIERFEPQGSARYVAFQTLHDPEQMPGQRLAILDWPYVEGLRMDEARHPLALMAVGMYGQKLPNQNGAPLRLVVPWKYGFKSIKSIVAIRFTETEPPTSWNRQAPQEYGFYANVNPAVDHPRWSQKRERRIGEFFKRETLPFNGYAEAVADLYRGMDLRRYY